MQQASTSNPDAFPAFNSAQVTLLVRLLKLGSLVNGPMKDGVCEPADVTQLELKVLMALVGEGALAGHDLVEIMGVPPMNVSRAIASLRARGWIEDTIDPDNRRRRPVRLSLAGIAKCESLGPRLEDVATALVGNLTTRQAREFAKAADRIIDNMADWITRHHGDVGMKR
ncbi:MarR family winged helix-turn-helix transcriptional regulator [Novosphingobium sp. CF614]|uniref:MarR family winged helix-turn-helix transcriptional regulator n=1 Tax=Novosphingobium sp. CF614 TaxID=1884364 RepID=UPI0015A6F03F|nr:MarR family transcriptional regulator [Novosphingobium sp. CF614]